MAGVVRKIVPVEALPPALREGFDPNQPVEIVQTPRMAGGGPRKASLSELRARIYDKPAKGE
jgi:hypothetical protein